MGGTGFEDCQLRVKEIIQKAGLFESNVTPYMDRAHRIGKRSPNKPRPIIVMFTYYRHKDHIIKNGSQFAGTGVNVSEDYSKQTLAVHRKLVEHAKKVQNMKVLQNSVCNIVEYYSHMLTVIPKKTILDRLV